MGSLKYSAYRVPALCFGNAAFWLHQQLIRYRIYLKCYGENLVKDLLKAKVTAHLLPFYSLHLTLNLVVSLHTGNWILALEEKNKILCF